MICANCVHLIYHIVEGRHFVDYELQEIMGRRLPRQQGEFFVDRATPRNNDSQRYLSVACVSLVNSS